MESNNHGYSSHGFMIKVYIFSRSSNFFRHTNQSIFGEKLYSFFWSRLETIEQFFFSGVEEMNKSMVEIQDYTQQLKNTADSINNQLTSLKSQISNTLDTCPTALTTDCDSIRSTVNSISVQPDFNDVSFELLNTTKPRFYVQLELP